MFVKQNILLTLFLFVNSSNFASSKISDRWTHLKDNKVRCWFLFQEGVLGKVENIPQVAMIIERFNFWFAKANCSIKLVEYIVHGSPDENGTYDGYIGQMQRHVGDIAYLLARPDSLPYEPMKIGPFFIPGDLSILTHKNESESVLTHEITSFLNINFEMYVYSFIVLFVIAPVVLVLEKLHRKNLEPKKIVKKYLSICNKVFNVLVDQEQFTPKAISARIMVLFVSIFVLIGIFGILLNTVGADLIVKKKASVIDSVDDLLESGILPLVQKRLFEYEMFRSSIPGSQVHKLWVVMQRDLNNSIFDYDLSAGDGGVGAIDIAVKTLSRVNRSESAMVMQDVNAHHFRAGVCYSKRQFNKLYEIFKAIHVSSEKFAGGMVSTLMSNQIHPYTEKLFSYVIQTLVETGISSGMQNLLTAKAGEITSSMGYTVDVKYNLEVIQCMEGISEEEEEKFRPFNTKDLNNLFECWSFLSCTWTLVLIFEILLSKYSRKNKKTRSAQVRQKFKTNSQWAVRTRNPSAPILSRERSFI